MPLFAMVHNDSGEITEISRSAVSFQRQLAGQDLYVLWRAHKPGDRIELGPSGEEALDPECLYWPVARKPGYCEPERLSDRPILGFECMSFRLTLTGRLFEQVLFEPIADQL